jgi:hypothetical protein
MEKRRYLLIVVGSAIGIQDDITNFADENGAYYVDGKGMFLSTFYSDFSTEDIFEFLMDRPACMVFDITEDKSYAVNLPKKYYLALFPEVTDILEKLDEEVISQKPKQKTKTKSTPKVEEYDSVDLILDKLSRNKYDRSCLTKRELNILEG